MTKRLRNFFPFGIAQRTIEQEFSLSWDYMEMGYFEFVSDSWEELRPIFNLIAELRKRGYDKKLRAGTSLASFILSRSHKHGLGSDQSRLTFNVYAEGGMTVDYFESPDVRIQIEVDHVALTPEIEALLVRLLSQPID